jgi:hypothetical protein
MRLALVVLLLACARRTEFIGVAPGWNCGARCFADENVPVPAAPLFATAPDPDAADKPALRYPLADSRWPINMGPPTLQWHAPRGTGNYYRLRVLGDAGRGYDFHVPCRLLPAELGPPPPDECTYPLPARAWALLAEENRGAEVTLTLAAADVPRAVVASADPIRIGFSPAAIEAGLYYFSTGRTGILRAPLGGAAQPFILPGTAADRFACAGCHAVSRDGRTIAFTADQKIGYLTVSPTDDPARPVLAPPPSPQADATTVSVSPDGSLTLTIAPAGALVVRESATGRERARLDPTPAGRLHFPEWSPDGREIAATLSTRDEDPFTVNDGSIVVLPFDGTAFGSPRTLVAGDGSTFHFSPSWSPDGQWLVFATAPRPGRSYDNGQARLRLVSRTGDRVIDLARAGGGRGATWPKVAPVSQADGQLLWVSFDGRLDYGTLLKNDVTPRPQLWLAAIDLRRLPADPSSPPVWLPFQDTHFVNVLGAWAPRLACGPQSPCADGAHCESGGCRPDP